MGWIDQKLYDQQIRSISENVYAISIRVYYFSGLLLALIQLLSLKKHLNLMQKVLDVHNYLKKDYGSYQIGSRRVQVFVGIMIVYMLFTIGFVTFLFYRYYGIGAVHFNVPLMIKTLITVVQILCFQWEISNFLKVCKHRLNENPIQHLLQTYVDATKINEKVNNVYSFQILTLIIASVMVIFAIGFGLSSKYIVPADFEGSAPQTIVDNVYLCVLYVSVSYLFLLSSAGSGKNKHREELLISANELIPTDENRASIISAVSSLPLNISAIIFNINYSFFINITAVIVSYLVFLVQFQSDYNQRTSNMFNQTTDAE